MRIPVQYGGGIRTQDNLALVADTGVRWAVLGTAAATGGDLLETAIKVLGDRLVVGVDCDEGMVATHGWQQRSQMSAQRFLHHLEECGAQRVVYTDVARDGMLGGPPGEKAVHHHRQRQEGGRSGQADHGALRWRGSPRRSSPAAPTLGPHCGWGHRRAGAVREGFHAG